MAEEEAAAAALLAARCLGFGAVGLDLLREGAEAAVFFFGGAGGCG